MFKFLEIELIGFTGLMLNNVHRFKLTFTSPYTLLLGCNGSGKSRLMAMLNPLPPSPDDFIEGGMKRIKIQYGEAVYTITTKFGKALKSTIVNDSTGEIIIEHANPSVHLIAAKKLFNWTKELNDIITGKILLTKMSVAERKKWFGLLSESDLTYALRFFKASRDRARDIEGVRKHLKRQVAELTPRVIEQSELLELARISFNRTTADIDDINKVIEKTNLAKPTRGVRAVNNIEKEINVVSTAILKSKYTHIDADLIELSHGIDARIKDLEERQQILHDEHVSLEIESSKYNAIEPEQLELLCTKISEYKNKLKELSLIPTEWTIANEDLQSITFALRVVPNIIAKLIDMAPNYKAILAEKTPLPQLFTALSDKVMLLHNDRRGASNRIADIEQYLKRAEDENLVDCPKCDNRFKPGYSIHNVEQAKANSISAHKELEQVKLSLEDGMIEVARIGDLVNAKSDIDSVLLASATHPCLKPLFAYYVKSIRKHDTVAKLNSFNEDISLHHEILLYSGRLEEASEKYNRLLAIETGDIFKIQILKDKLMVEMDDISIKLSLFKKERRDINNNRDHYSKLEENIARMNALGHEHVDALYSDHLNVMSDECAGYRDTLMSRLAESRHRLMRMDQEVKELARLSKELIGVEETLISVRSIIKAISPEEGVLSGYLHRSMVGITELMTAYINSVWSYEMCINPCDFSSGDLDYKFPFWVKEKSKQVKDISRASKGQKEIIDFVFVLAVYRAMGLEGYPLLLDEISSGFDEEHRSTMIDYVKELVDTEQHLQLIMVSHDSSTHYRLANAALCVLDPVGVTLPEKYNEHVLIT